MRLHPALSVVFLLPAAFWHHLRITAALVVFVADGGENVDCFRLAAIEGRPTRTLPCVSTFIPLPSPDEILHFPGSHGRVR